MLIGKGDKLSTRLGPALDDTNQQLPYYPTEATMVYDPIHHDGLTIDQWRDQERRTRQYRPKRRFFKGAGAKTLSALGLRPPLDSTLAPDYHESDKAAKVRRFQKAIAVTAIGVLALGANRLSGEWIGADSHPTFSKIASSQNHQQNCAMFVGTGFGTLKADQAARALESSLTKYGDVYSLQYDNDPRLTPEGDLGTVNIGNITDEAEKIVIENGYTCVSADGHSYGGLALTDMMAELSQRIPELDMDYIFLDGTPTDITTVRDNEQQKGYILMTALTNKWLKQLNGPYVRGPIELSQRINSMYDCDLDQYTCNINWDGVEWAFKEAQNRMTDKAASNGLLGTVFNSIVVSDIKTSLETLAKMNVDKRPTIIYVRPDDPTRDHTVNAEMAEAKLRNYTNELGFRLVIINLPSPAGHADPSGSASDKYKKGYDQVFETIDPHPKVYVYPPEISKNTTQFADSFQQTTVVDIPG